MQLPHKKIIFICLSFAFLFSAGFCYALELSYPTIMGFSIADNATIFDYAKYFFNLGTGLAIILAVFAIIAGGIYWLVSFGQGKFTDEGKQWVKSGVIGLILTLSAYIIASTINPELTGFKPKDLPVVGGWFSVSDIITKGPPRTIYQEIPIGTLTETLLARTTDCYDFDSYGDPISEDVRVDSGEKIAGPTFLDRDRIDCISKLSEATKKKADLIYKLSQKIADLMKKCKCTEENGCKGQGDCTDVGGGAITIDPKTCGAITDCQKLNCECEDSCKDLCPEKVKETVAHGPIQLEGTSADFLTLFPNADQAAVQKLFDCMEPEMKIKKYKGLEEFKTELTSVSPVVEMPGFQINEKPITVIDLKKWEKLNLIEQFLYLKERAEKYIQQLQYDLISLQRAEYTLAKCYYAKPYVEFLRIKEETNSNNEIILSNKYMNNYEGAYVDISRYCKGYEYANSECYHNCEKICPALTPDTISCYKKCPDCKNFNCASDDQQCNSDKEECLQKQNSCMNDCYNLRACPLADNSTNFKNFQECIASCKNDCNSNCSKNNCSKIENACKKCVKDNGLSLSCNPLCASINATISSCQEKCENNSLCILDPENRKKCLFDYDSAQKCADVPVADSGNFKKCVNDSFFCQYGSDQYAGYTDVFIKQWGLSGNDFSSSLAYKTPDLLKCPECYKKVKVNPSDPNNKAEQVCSERYPEAVKGPSCSDCPQCPCDTLFAPVEPGTGSGNTITDYRVVTGKCQEFAYNDDPLTFYCKQNWWEDTSEKNTEALGNERYCSKEGEIPVGQTVDDAEAWAKKFYTYLYYFVRASQSMADQILTIGRESNYCQCNSECGDGTRPCGASCGPDAEPLMGQDENGNPVPVLDENGNFLYVCTCKHKRACAGNPCQKMINLINGQASNKYGCPKNTRVYSINTYFKSIVTRAKQMNDFNNNALGRTDILKKLVYSRYSINSCSVAQKRYEGDPKLFSCTRVEDENMPPISDRNYATIINNREVLFNCYGNKLGEVYKSSLSLPTPLMDNWFCCEKR